MIFTNVSIVVNDGKSKQDRDIYIYRGDKNIEIRFTIESPFRYTDISNLIEDSEAYYAQLVIKKPNSDDFIYSPLDSTEYGIAKVTITAEMIDEIIEVGDYDYQIILYDESINSRVTIPPIIGGLKVLEPISLQTSLPNEKAIVNKARVGYSIITMSNEALETFDEEENYNKTIWKDNDLVTDNKLNKIEDALYSINEKANEVIFETDKLIISPLGGISEGTDLNELSVKEVLSKLLYPYIKPIVSVTTTPNGGLYECGKYQTISNIRVAITKKTEPITLLRILDDGKVIYTKNSSLENGGTFDVPCNLLIKDNKRFTIEVIDSTGSIVAENTNVFDYIYPYYYGVVNEGTLLTGDFIKFLTKKVEAKGEKNLTFTTNNQKMVFAYPTSYGQLYKILDTNNFDVTNTFTAETVNLTATDGTTQSYYVYVNGASTVQNFAMKFIY